MGFVTEVSEAGAGPFVGIEGGLRAGFTWSDSTTNGISIAAQLPLYALLGVATEEGSGFGFLKYSNIDVYVTGPKISERSTAIGVTWSTMHTMPYVQVGRFSKSYITQALMVSRSDDFWLWAPSYTTLLEKRPGRATHITLTGGLGNDGDTDFWMVGLSLIFEFYNARP